MAEIDMNQFMERIDVVEEIQHAERQQTPPRTGIAEMLRREAELRRTMQGTTQQIRGGPANTHGLHDYYQEQIRELEATYQQQNEFYGTGTTLPLDARLEGTNVNWYIIDDPSGIEVAPLNVKPNKHHITIDEQDFIEYNDKVYRFKGDYAEFYEGTLIDNNIFENQWKNSIINAKDLVILPGKKYINKNWKLKYDYSQKQSLKRGFLQSTKPVIVFKIYELEKK